MGVKLFWVKTKARWKRTKYLQCNCHTNNRGVETCKYKRRGYNYEEEMGRSGGQRKLEIACSEPACTNPAESADFNTGSVGMIHNPAGIDGSASMACVNYNINNGRGGT